MIWAGGIVITLLILLVCLLAVTAASRRKLEQLLRESEAEYRSIFNNATEGMFRTTPDGRFLNVNPAMAGLLGFDSPRQMMEHCLDIAGQIYVDGSRRRKLLEEVLEKGQVIGTEVASRRKDGGVISVLINIHRVNDREGNLICLEGTATDITVQKRDEEAMKSQGNELRRHRDHLEKLVFERTKALNKSREQLELALDAVNDGVWDVNLLTGEAYFSPTCYTMLGYDPGEMPATYRSFVSLQHPEEKERAGQVVKNAMATGEPFSMELRLRCKDGSWLWVLDRGKTVSYTDEGKPLRMVGTHTDISRRKETEQQLQQTLVELETIFDNSRVGLMLLRGGRKLAKGNQRLADILGYDSPEEMAGISMRRLHLTEERFHEFGRIYYANLEKREQIQIEYRLRRKDGTPVWCMLSGKAFDTADPPDLDKGVLWVIDDITRIKQVEEELKSARDQAREATRIKSDFLARMSHEIRTPMNAVIGMAHLILQTELTEKQADYVNKIQSSAHTLLGIINDILDFSKVEAGKLKLEETGFRLDDVLGKLSDIIGLDAENKGLAFTFRVDPEIPEYLKGDPLRLGQVLTNLAGNAVKFTEKGEITVSVELENRTGQDTFLLFSVRDTGIGMDEDALAGLFDPFRQADGSTSRKYGGTGLGLSIADHLVELMGGTLNVQSTPGKGSCFYFTAAFRTPDREARPKPYPARDMPKAPVSLKNARVLVVEDNELNRQVALELLEQAAFAADTVKNGREALAAIRKTDYDLVLMDIEMPEMDGHKATRAIRKAMGSQSPPIVAMTAHALEGDREKSIQAGMDDFLTKPVDPEQLHRVLTGWIRTEHSRIPERSGRRKIEEAAASGIPEMKTVNLEAALKKFGNKREFLFRLLAEFYRSHRKTGDRVQELMENRDPEAARLLVHSVKGTAGNLQADRLFTAASRLENNLKTDDTDTSYPEHELNGFRCAIGETMAELAPIAEMKFPFRTEENIVPAGTEFVTTRLQSLLALGDLDAMNLLENLKDAYSDDAGPDEIRLVREICDLTQDFEFETALEKLETLAETSMAKERG